MATETEQLQAEANKNRKEGQIRELNAYLDELTKRIDGHIGKCKQAFLIWLVVWTGWVLSTFLEIMVLNLVCFAAFFVAWVFMIYRERELQGAVGELKGALKVLKILGLSDYDWNDLGNKKRKRVWNKGVEMVKGWFKQKKEVQEKVYAPA